jgi:YgiT-type zinc finger domain-containing protein
MNTEKMSRMWQQKSQEEFEHFATWRAAHEDATLAEIETVMDQHLNRVRAAVLQQAAQASEPLEEPGPTQQRCRECGGPLQSRGKQQRHLQTNGGEMITLQRHYLKCSRCGSGFFSPR